MQRPRSSGVRHAAGPSSLAVLLKLVLAALRVRCSEAGFLWLPGFSNPAPAPPPAPAPGPAQALPQPVPEVQPNPPQWPPSVHVFGPQDDPGAITAAVNQAFAVNGGHTPIDHGQFSMQRFAFLFRPGTYHVDIPVGYYTQVLGLGLSPADVIFDGPRGVFCEEGDQTDMGGSLSTFWRGAENFHHTGPDGMLWAVSQAAPVRRAMVDKDVNLAQLVNGVGMGYASGGFVANLQVGGTINSASQQQWCARNVGIAGPDGWQGAVWNMVFIGSSGVPASHCGNDGGSPFVNVATTPLITEKPFIAINGAGKYTLQVPPLQRDRVGYDFAAGRTVDFEKVFVAKDSHTAAQINRHLAAGLDVVLSPGVYHLEAPLELTHNNQVLLGLGLATLVPDKGTAVVRVGNVDGVHIAGVLLQAGTGETDALLEWGDGSHPGDANNPGFLHDVFARVGGPNDPSQYQVRAKVMVRIASGHVVGDNLWLWRADHGVSGIVKSSMNPCDHGLIVTGAHVTMYGLATEHTLQDLVQWSGDDGATYFFQSELPYDVTPAFGDAGFVGYRVNDTVTTHKAYGVGVYHYFRDFPVTVQRGIAVPDWLENSFTSPLSVSLTGKGTMLHVLNNRGLPTHGDAGVQWSCEQGPVIAPHPRATSAPRITTAGPTAAPPPVVTTPTTLATTPLATTASLATTPMLPATTTPVATTSTLPVQTTPILATTAAPAGGCVQGYAKCGGKGWDGPVCCADGFLCTEMGIWYSQCLPKNVKFEYLGEVSSGASTTAATTKPPPPPPPPPPPTTPRLGAPTEAPTAAPGALCAGPWAKCGGVGWTGPTCCTPGSTCVPQSQWLSECTPSPTAPEESTVHTNIVFFKKDSEAPFVKLDSRPPPGVHPIMWWVLILVPIQCALMLFIWRLKQQRSTAQPANRSPGPRQAYTPGCDIRFRELSVLSPSPQRRTSRNELADASSP